MCLCGTRGCHLSPFGILEQMEGYALELSCLALHRVWGAVPGNFHSARLILCGFGVRERPRWEGWEKSELRAKMNSGEIWNLMPSDLQSKVKAVTKLTNNVNGTDKNAAVTATSDKLFLLSYSEIVPTSYWASSYPWTSYEGAQYEAFKGKVTNNYSGNESLKIGSGWWERSVNPNGSDSFLIVYTNGDPSYSRNAAYSYCVCPAFCF